MYQVARKLYELTCPCGKKFELLLREREFASLKCPKHCSRWCAGHFRVRTEESKKKTSSSLRGRPSPRKGSRCPRETTPIDRRAKNHICEFCHAEFYAAGKRRFCSRKCLTDLVKIRRTKREVYKYSCTFKFNVYDYPDKFDLALLTEHGWYKATNRGNNLNGVSRDHMLSIADGFNQNIDPAIIAHPANCALILHRANQRKNKSSSITFDELQKRIKCWGTRTR